MTEAVVVQKKSSVGKIIGCGCAVLFLAVVAIIASIFFGVFGLLKKSEPYTESLKAVKTNPAAVEALGEPIEPGFLLSGSINFENGDGTADISIPVSGPKAEGTIKVEGTKDSSGWSYQVWELRVEGMPEAIPLGK